jgi:uncharacterized protein (TIGR03084 family)
MDEVWVWRRWTRWPLDGWIVTTAAGVLGLDRVNLLAWREFLAIRRTSRRTAPGIDARAQGTGVAFASPVDEIAAALAAQDEELAGLLTGCDADDWQRATPCEGWTVADVVLHVAQTNEFAIASADGTLTEAAGLGGAEGRDGNVDDAAADMVEQERGASGDEVFARWRAAADRFLALVDGADLHRRVPWVTGYLSVQTLIATRLSETWIHTTDVADAFGVQLPLIERLRYVARLAWRTLPYAFARSGRELSGPVEFDLRGPGGDAWSFVPDEPAVTTVRGEGTELCLVAARRLAPSQTSLRTEGPDGAAVLDLVRTYA